MNNVSVMNLSDWMYRSLLLMFQARSRAQNSMSVTAAQIMASQKEDDRFLLDNIELHQVNRKRIIHFSEATSSIFFICRVLLVPQQFKFFKTGVFHSEYTYPVLKVIFIALIHPIQWTIAYPVGADRPAKRQKKTSCVSTGQAGPVLCTRQMACRTSFLSRQSDVIASFSFGARSVQAEFSSEFNFYRFY